MWYEDYILHLNEPLLDKLQRRGLFDLTGGTQNFGTETKTGTGLAHLRDCISESPRKEPLNDEQTSLLKGTRHPRRRNKHRYPSRPPHDVTTTIASSNSSSSATTTHYTSAPRQLTSPLTPTTTTTTTKEPHHTTLTTTTSGPLPGKLRNWVSCILVAVDPEASFIYFYYSQQR